MSEKSWIEAHVLGVRWRELPSLLPGVVVALGMTLLAVLGADSLWHHVLRQSGQSPVSAITVAVVLGILVGNTLGVPKALGPGLDFCVKKALRLGIILIGLKLSLLDVLQLGVFGVPVVVTVIACGLGFTIWFAQRVGLSERMGVVTAAATSICGVTAAVSVAPVVEADEQEVSYAVANVTLYGVLGMLAYPYLAHAVLGDHPQAAGMFLGTSIHDTSQVMGAALSYKQLFDDEVAFKAATITKLTRNVFLVLVVPFLAFRHARRHGRAGKTARFADLFPTFVLGFLAMVLLRTAGDQYWPSDGWKTLIKNLTEVGAVAALGAAMASVGLTTNLARLRGLGLKPLWVGGVSATVVGLVGMALARAVAALG
jgi:uncharacterized integral membrane protein (TIGR00698 family)